MIYMRSTRHSMDQANRSRPKSRCMGAMYQMRASRASVSESDDLSRQTIAINDMFSA